MLPPDSIFMVSILFQHYQSIFDIFSIFPEDNLESSKVWKIYIIFYFALQLACCFTLQLLSIIWFHWTWFERSHRWWMKNEGKTCIRWFYFSITRRNMKRKSLLKSFKKIVEIFLLETLIDFVMGVFLEFLLKFWN